MPSHMDSSGHAIENAFTRHPRPQRMLDLKESAPIAPTKAALMQKAKSHTNMIHQSITSLSVPIPKAFSNRTNTAASPEVSVATLNNTSGVEQLQELITLGTLVQGETEWVIHQRKHVPGMIMSRKLKKEHGLVEKDILGQVAHNNIVKIKQAFLEGEFLRIGVEYCRFTLEEIIHVRVGLEEAQLQFIARSVFNALNYLRKLGISHYRVSLTSIRVSGRDVRVLLSNFEEAVKYAPNVIPNTDLEDLGFVLLACMERRPRPQLRDINYIREQRAINKVFGLHNSEHWSGCNQLIDFLDDLFNSKKTAFAKFSKPHHFITSTEGDGRCLEHYLELVSFELFTLWNEGGDGMGGWSNDWCNEVTNLRVHNVTNTPRGLRAN